MFLFRAVFIIGFISVSLVAHVSAMVFSLSRYLLDVIPEDAQSPDAGANLVSVSDLAAESNGAGVENSSVVDGLDHETETSLAPSAADDAEATSASAVAESTSTPLAKSRLAQANAASPIIALASSTVLVSSVVAGILLSA